MEELSSREKVLKAAQFLKSSPPGEIDDIFNDIRGLVNDDVTLQDEIGPVLADCNTAQFYCASLPDSETEKVVQSEDYSSHVEEDSFRDDLQLMGNEYISEHYAGGKISVFPINFNLFPESASHLHTEPDAAPLERGYIFCIINNRYSPENFYNGRWQSTWSFNQDTSVLTGSLKIHIHYYEDGNVQLNVEKNVSEEIAPEGDDLPQLAASIFSSIKKLEKQIQLSMNENYQFLADHTFKDLRRKLPLTRSKVDWLKIANYNIGEQLGNVNH
ncbi:F-actin-capping protein subunit alpha-2 [Smittium mucronatum]|uniref:F-actin-capping protein subunit alpha n=1 Tax=Smittium mucronatum TaxID=133383 RepID=A0A1R0H8H2_9FUNG|nr:F-actin-capping protein subunit alpha-2 [Smittium mucronatum]